LDPRSPFVLDTRTIGRATGRRQVYTIDAPAPDLLGLDMIGVDEGAPLALSVQLESVSEGVLATGSITGELRGECGRCLIEFSEPLRVDFAELFSRSNSPPPLSDGEGEVRRLDGDFLDLEPVVRDTVVLSLPLTPLCSANCGGLCSECGERLDELPLGHIHIRTDPRWTALTERAVESISTTDSQE
jgi:uncharacterized protein